MDTDIRLSISHNSERKPWSESDTQMLLSDYLVYRNKGKLSTLAKSMGRTKPFMCRKAASLGLTKQHHEKAYFKKDLTLFRQVHDNFTDAQLAKRFGVVRSTITKWRTKLGLRKDRSKAWQRTPHPKGFNSHRHSVKAKEKMSKKSRAAWADLSSGLNSEKTRQGKSDRMASRQASGELVGGYSRGKSGKRADLGGLYLRSSWEANYARYLNFLLNHGEIDRWEYEPDTFWFHAIKRGTRSYLPDFKVLESGLVYYVEVKGWMDQKSKTKLRRMAKYYPDTEIRLVDKKPYLEIQSKLGRLIVGWEFPGDK